MSVPDDKQLGFDPMLTDWLRKSNAAKVATQAGATEDTPIFGGYAKIYDWFYSFLNEGKLSPLEKRTIDSRAMVDVAMAGGSPDDIKQVSKDVNSVFKLNEAQPPITNYDWLPFAVIGLIALIAYLILKEVL